MTLKQKLLRSIYPLLMKAGKWFGIKRRIVTINNTKLFSSFYNLTATANNNAEIAFKNFKEKKVLIVNTASECGYTAQFYELEKLHEMHKSNLVVIGFPANDFKKQEPGSDAEIAEFCRITFGTQFLLMKKSVVLKGTQQNEVYQWLTDKNKNGWNEIEPEWNFSKYLIDEQGILTHYFGPSVSPLSSELLKTL